MKINSEFIFPGEKIEEIEETEKIEKIIAERKHFAQYVAFREGWSRIIDERLKAKSAPITQ